MKERVSGFRVLTEPPKQPNIPELSNCWSLPTQDRVSARSRDSYCEGRKPLLRHHHCGSEVKAVVLGALFIYNIAALMIGTRSWYAGNY